MVGSRYCALSLGTFALLLLVSGVCPDCLEVPLAVCVCVGSDVLVALVCVRLVVQVRCVC